MPRQRSRRVEHLNQPLERQVLVAVGGQIGRPHPRDQLAEARIARRVGAQHQRVDEEPDQVVERAVGAARNRAADRDVAARPQPRQQGRQRGLQHHEQARPSLARQCQQASMQLRRQRQRHAVAAIARHRRPRPIARQVDLVGKLLERLGPECQLACDRALRIALLPQHLVLPQRVVGILHRQRRQVGRLSVAPRRIGMGEIARQRRQRPAVARNVMEQQQQDVLACPRARTDAPAAEARSRARSPAAPPAPEPPAGSPR